MSAKIDRYVLRYYHEGRIRQKPFKTLREARDKLAASRLQWLPVTNPAFMRGGLADPLLVFGALPPKILRCWTGFVRGQERNYEWNQVRAVIYAVSA